MRLPALMREKIRLRVHPLSTCIPRELTATPLRRLKFS
jgi:hypothetical protein